MEKYVVVKIEAGKMTNMRCTPKQHTNRLKIRQIQCCAENIPSYILQLRQARNQLGTPGEAKTFMRVGPNFLNYHDQ